MTAPPGLGSGEESIPFALRGRARRSMLLLPSAVREKERAPAPLESETHGDFPSGMGRIQCQHDADEVKSH